MKKHSVILDINCDKLTFWPDHCQHSRVKNLLVLPVKAEPHIIKQYVSTLKLNKLIRKNLKLLLTSVKQLAKSIDAKYIVPAKRIQINTKQDKVSKTIPKASLLLLFKAQKSIKSIELTMIGAAPFQYLTN